MIVLRGCSSVGFGVCPLEEIMEAGLMWRTHTHLEAMPTESSHIGEARESSWKVKRGFL